MKKKGVLISLILPDFKSFFTMCVTKSSFRRADGLFQRTKLLKLE